MVDDSWIEKPGGFSMSIALRTPPRLGVWPVAGHPTASRAMTRTSTRASEQRERVGIDGLREMASGPGVRHSTTRSKSVSPKGARMIYEIRTYQIAPGSLAEVEKRFGEAYEYRKKYSPLTAFWHTEIGPLNEIIHVWGYQDLAERAKIRAEAAKDGTGPPRPSRFIGRIGREITNRSPSVPPPSRGRWGPVLR